MTGKSERAATDVILDELNRPVDLDLFREQVRDLLESVKAEQSSTMVPEGHEAAFPNMVFQE